MKRILLSSITCACFVYSLINCFAYESAANASNVEVPRLLVDPQGEYVPLPGQIPRGLANVNDVHKRIAEALRSVPNGPDGRSSQWFTKLQDLNLTLERVQKSKAQTDLLATIPRIAELFISSDESELGFVDECIDALRNLSATILFSIRQHIAERNAIVAPETLKAFVNVFSIGGFVSEPDWEEAPMPINAAGVLILDPIAVIAYLKAQPKERAERFLGGHTAETAFKRYLEDGDGLPVLKAKYARERAAIIAKWSELTDWVSKQHAPSPK